jgi:hypothetical protein
VRLVENRRGATPWFVAGATLLFHAHYVYAGTLVATVLAHAALFHRTKDAWRRLALGLGASAALCAPWAIWLAGMRYGERYGDRVFDPSRAAANAWSFVRQLFEHVMPWWFVAAGGVAIVVLLALRRVRTPAGQAVALPLLFVAVNVVALALVVPGPFFRYLAPVIPFLFAPAGAAIAALSRVRPPAGPVLAVGAVAALLVHQPLRDYAHELTHDYVGPGETIVRHLETRARPTDVVAAPYGDMTLKFHSPLRVVGALTGEDMEAARDADFVILCGHIISPKEMPFRAWLEEHLDARDYRLVELDAPDLPFENREDPALHHYRTVTEGPRIRLLERIRSE